MTTSSSLGAGWLEIYIQGLKNIYQTHLVELAGNQGWESFAWNVFGWFQKLSAKLFLLARGSCIESLGI